MTTNIHYSNRTPDFDYKFSLDDKSNWLKFLHRHGWVVISNLTSPEEVKSILSLQWDYLESLGTGLDRNNPHTWYEKVKWPLHKNGQIMTPYAAHCAAVWRARQLSQVRTLFETIYDTSELQVSFDTMNILRPVIAHKYQPEPLLPHIDVDPATSNYQVQGFLNLIRSDTESGGLYLLDRGHQRYDDWIDKKSPSGRCHVIKDRDKLMATMIKPNLKPGDFVVWDSRVIHGVAPPVVTSLKVSQLGRSIVYITMTPRKRISKSNQELIKDWFKRGVMSCHHMDNPTVKDLKLPSSTKYKNVYIPPVLTDPSLISD